MGNKTGIEERLLANYTEIIAYQWKIYSEITWFPKVNMVSRTLVAKLRPFPGHNLRSDISNAFVASTVHLATTGRQSEKDFNNLEFNVLETEMKCYVSLTKCTRCLFHWSMHLHNLTYATHGVRWGTAISTTDIKVDSLSTDGEACKGGPGNSTGTDTGTPVF